MFSLWRQKEKNDGGDQSTKDCQDLMQSASKQEENTALELSTDSSTLETLPQAESVSMNAMNDTNQSEEQQTEALSPSSPSTSYNDALMMNQSAGVNNESERESNDRKSQSPHDITDSSVVSTANAPIEMPDNWPDALYLACTSQSTFVQTPRQVLEKQTRITRPRQDCCIMLDTNDVTTTAKNVVAEIHKHESVSSSSPSLSRRVYNSVTGTVSWGMSKLYQYTIADPDDYNEEELEWTQVADEYDDSVPLVEWEAPVVCIPLVTKCVQELAPHTGDLKAVVLNQTASKYSFVEWATTASPSIASQPDLLQQRRDRDLVAQVLVQAAHAVMVENKYLVFGNSPSKTDVDYATSLLKLQMSIEAVERQIQDWQHQDEACTRMAQIKMQRNDIKGAKLALAKRKLLQSNIQHSQASLLNLHQVAETLKLSQIQKTHVHQSLKEASSVLQTMREDVSLEQVDQVMLDLQEASDHFNDVSSTLNQEQEFDEEALLQELEQLSLNDNDGDNNVTQKDTQDTITRVSAVESQPEPVESEHESNDTEPKHVAESSQSQDTKPSSQANEAGREAQKEDTVATPAL